MHAPAVIFCERSGDWAAAWRRMTLTRLGPSASRWLPIAETRGIVPCREAWRATPTALLALELCSDSIDRTLEFLAVLSSARTPARAALLLTRSGAPYEGLARELGAVIAIANPREIGALLPIVQRQLAERPAEPLPLLERLWQELPWEVAARSATIQATSKPGR